MGEEFEESVKGLVALGYKFKSRPLQDAKRQVHSMVDSVIKNKKLSLIERYEDIIFLIHDLSKIETYTKFKTTKSVDRMNKRLMDREIGLELEVTGYDEFEKEMYSRYVRVDANDYEGDYDSVEGGYGTVMFQHYLRIDYLVGNKKVDYTTLNVRLEADEKKLIEFIKVTYAEDFNRYFEDKLEEDEEFEDDWIDIVELGEYLEDGLLEIAESAGLLKNLELDYWAPDALN